MACTNCSNCYDGCVSIISDKCVKYTGVDIPELGIETGIPLSEVEQILTTFLVSVIDGTGIIINIDESAYCTLVSQYLEGITDVRAVDLFSALIKAACN